MPDETLLCPSCHRKVRMAESHQGQFVQCPLCGVVFRAPARLPAVPTVPPPASEATPAPAETPRLTSTLPRESAQASAGGDPGRPVVDVQRALLMPGVGLLVCGILGAIASLIVLRNDLASGEEGVLRLLEENYPPGLMKMLTDSMSHSTIYAVEVGTRGLGALVSLGIVIGAIRMLRLQGYRLAMLGSVLAFLNVPNAPCCLLTMPLGLWSFMVLRLPEVRSAFDAPPGDLAAADEEKPEEE